MHWDVEGSIRLDIHFFSGIAYAGDHWHVAIRGGEVRRGDVPGHAVRSMGIVAMLGTEVTIKSRVGDDWEGGSWRTILFTEDDTFLTGEKHIAGSNKLAIHIPDLDLIHHCAASRVDYNREEYFPQVKTYAERRGWTWGRNPDPLQQNIKAVTARRLTEY